ncbi:uncharacterized protein BX664DRAFT_329710 [Halteromyces radiatus]|uniref:uncharacterized protein n=1 Tax=Halteromyces radiatus TaxID=101107 RepID=UPI00221F8339|nr:uncharacterized protein BX664DRAFT_329710 [Halteromyces radiatus]KAI8093439.1 hypothetical protein BX664DRAFT_329710 [Halteromyces radiatus]
MPTLNGRPYHLTMATISSFYNEPSYQRATSPPPPQPEEQERMTLQMARERAAATAAVTTFTTSTNTSNIRSGSIRQIPRIPRLRRPLVATEATEEDEQDNERVSIPYLQHMSISSAITTTAAAQQRRRRQRLPSSPPHEHCLDPVDLSALFGNTCDYSSLTKQHENSYDYLDFRLKLPKIHPTASPFSVENFISYHHGAVYRIFDSQNTVDMALEYVGHKHCCVVSQIILRSPQTGYSPPCRDGMVLISHHPFNEQDTRRLDHFTKADYERYQETNTDELYDGSYGGDDDQIAAWFRITDDQPVIVNLGERSGRYILIKFFPAEHESASLDLQYIAFLGYVGSRSFAKGQLC